MTIRKRVNRATGETQWFIDIQYRTGDGKRRRFRRDAQVNTQVAARAEDRRLMFELGQRGTLQRVVPEKEDRAPTYCFEEAVKQFRATHLPLLKPSTRWGYQNRLNDWLLPRFGKKLLSELDSTALAAFDLDLANDGLAASTRRGLQITFRSVLRVAVTTQMLPSMPSLPRFPKVGRKLGNAMHRVDLDLILSVSSPHARLAFALAAFAGLRASEVRGLQWSDIDLRGGAIAIRRGVTRGETTTPKSGEPRTIPIAGPLRALLEAMPKPRLKPWAPVAVTAQGKVWGESGLNQAFKRAQERAGRTGWCFHDLRHFFVTELFRRGAPAPAVQRLAGHADLATTERYADMSAGDLQAAIDLFEGNAEATSETRR